MNKIDFILLAVLTVAFATGAIVAQTRHPGRTTVIPKPAVSRFANGHFTLGPDTTIRISLETDPLKEVADYLARKLENPLGRLLQVAGEGNSTTNSILLTLADFDPTLGREGYNLVIESEAIRITAPHPAGIFYGIQTLLQMLDSTDPQGLPSGTFQLPGLYIDDKPSYRWRGLLLDSCRHFQSKEFIKRYIDLLAYHKLNILHWHLTDDQGWRVEIQQYPKLMEVGAWRGQGEDRYGGYYSKEDIREIVDYAARRFVTVVPEIEMPGHARAAVASYPELSCHGEPLPVATQWGIMKEIFCAGKDSTFEFLEGVLGEVIELFPSAYIHIGGDEAPKDSWEKCPHCQQRIRAEGLKDEKELQTYLIQRVQKFVEKHNRKIIGWDEIYEGGLPPGAIVQWWKHNEYAEGAISEGHEIVSSLHWFTYLDYPMVREGSGKPDWMPELSLEKIYSYNPIPEGTPATRTRLVLGGESAMWTEHAPQDKIDFQVFPRLTALAEVLWTPEPLRNFADFQARLKSHYGRLKALGVQYDPSAEGR